MNQNGLGSGMNNWIWLVEKDWLPFIMVCFIKKDCQGL